MADIYQKLHKDYLIDELVENMVQIPGEDLARFLESLDINLPRSIRFNALQKILFPILQDEYNDLLKHESSTEGPERLEESRRQTRLRWIDTFSETQFENELFRFNNREIDLAYLSEFWKRLINFLIKESVPKQLIADFLEGVIGKYQSQPPAKLFNKAIDPFIYDEEGTFDGLITNLFEKRVLVSATISELKQIGAKYGIKVPTRLTKIQVLEIIVSELKDRDKYIPEIHSELNDFNLKELEEFARLNDIIAFAYINKDQMIDIILTEYEEKKPIPNRYKKDEDVVPEIEDEVPATESVAEEIIEEKTEIIEDVVAEEIIEEKVEEIIETKVFETPQQTIAHYDSSSLEELKKEIILLKESVNNLKNEIVLLEEKSTNKNAKPPKLSKGSVPRWFAILIMTLFFIGLFFLIFTPLAYYYPDAPVISQISWLLSKIPFFGGRDFLTFIKGVFESRFVV